MVLVLPGNHKRSFSQGLMGGLAQNLPRAIEELTDRKRGESKEKLLRTQEEQNRLKQAQALGISGDIRDPNVIKELVKEREKESSSNRFLQSLGLGGGSSLINEAKNGLMQQPQEKRNMLENITPEQRAALSIKFPQLANLLEKQQEFKQRQDLAKEDREFKSKEAEVERNRKEELKFHEEGKDIDNEIRESAKRSKKQIEAIKDIEKAIATKKIKPGSIPNIFRGLGIVGDKIANAFSTAEQGQFEAALPVLIEGWKEVFGVRLSDADLKLLESKLPGIGKEPEANKSILKIIEKYAQPNIHRAEIAREIKKQNKGLRPLNFADQVEEKLEERLPQESSQNEPQRVKVRNKKTGQVGTITTLPGWEDEYEPV